MTDHEPVQTSYDASCGVKHGPYHTTAASNAFEPTNWDAELRYQKCTFYLVLFYIPLLITPWILTCVLDVRPLGQAAYVNQRGHFLAKDLDAIIFSTKAVRILNSIATVVTIPVISAILGQAAVVYTQRRKARQALNVPQVFALADRGWTNYMLLWNAVFTNQGRRAGSLFLWLAAAVVLLASIQQPLQTVLVKDESILLVTCEDIPEFYYEPKCDYLLDPPAMVGFDPEPGYMAWMSSSSSLIKLLYERSLTTSLLELQPNIWPELSSQEVANRSSALNGTLGAYIVADNDDTLPMVVDDFFVSSISNTVQTGVLRQHALRMNSTVNCFAIPHEDFPTVCPGASPFETQYSESTRVGNSDIIWNSQLNIRICVPGDAQRSLFNLSRDRQDITEDLYIDVVLYPPGSADSKLDLNFALHCTVATTRGYFELGNSQNNYKAGPLLQTWPSQTSLWTDFNDFTGNETGAPPNVIASDISVLSEANWLHNYRPVPSPLMLAAMTLFGSDSFFGRAQTVNSSQDETLRILICNTSTAPLANLDIMTPQHFVYKFPIERIHDSVKLYCGFPAGPENATIERDLTDEFLYTWFLGFGQSANAYLSSMLFLTHETLLTNLPALPSQEARVAFENSENMFRIIYSSPGTTITKPHKSRNSTIIISVLILLQLLAIVLLIAYIYQTPTWTSTLNALAVARIGAYLERTHRPRGLSIVKDEDAEIMEELAKLDGLIGVEEDMEMGAGGGITYGEESRWSEGGRLSTGGATRLGVGAKGIVLRTHARKGRKRFSGPSSRGHGLQGKQMILGDGESGMPLRGTGH